MGVSQLLRGKSWSVKPVDFVGIVWLIYVYLIRVEIWLRANPMLHTHITWETKVQNINREKMQSISHSLHSFKVLSIFSVMTHQKESLPLHKNLDIIKQAQLFQDNGDHLCYLHIVEVGGSNSCWFRVSMWVKHLQLENNQAGIQTTPSSPRWNLCQSRCRFEMAEGPGNSGAGRLETDKPEKD